MTREPVVAGMFYPGVPGELEHEVRSFLAEAAVDAVPPDVGAMVVPHAGYPYSGPTAGHGYARVQGTKPGRVVLLGRSHRYAFENAAVFPDGAFETPLGTCRVDGAFAQALDAEFGGGPVEAHAPEHSLEVQLPFVQVALGNVPIVPVLFGADPAASHIAFGQRLAQMLEPGDLVVASTDLSHYLSEDEANALDEATLQAILSQDCDAVARGVRSGACSMCGAPAVVAAMACALERGARDWRLCDYRTSAAVSGDYERVVGYGAITMARAAA